LNIFFRTDSSLSIGTGHLNRCINLADELKKMNNNIFFISRNLPGNSNFIIKKRRYPILSLPKPTNYSITDNYNDWLGIPWFEDLNQTIKVISKLNKVVHWMIIDHYSLDQNWESNIRNIAKKVLVIDGPIHNKHYCDILLNSNYLKKSNNHYIKKINYDCKLLLGSKYCLIKNEKKLLKNKKNEKKYIRLLIFYGGIDINNQTLRALKSIKHIRNKLVYTNLVIGKNNPNKKELLRYSKNLKNIKVHIQTKKMYDLITNSDIGLCAGGINTWERLYLGLPSIVTAVSKNQESSLKKLNTTNSIVYLGSYQNVTIKKISENINLLLKNKSRLKNMSKIGKKLVDGRGVQRVSQIIKKLS
tara:strand:- start:1270 stop:2346 length:1077 start_codon:yes stop_codon:yes gene_type:complete